MGCIASNTGVATAPTTRYTLDSSSYIRKASTKDQHNGSASTHQRNESAKQNARRSSAKSHRTSASSTTSKRKKKSIVGRQSSSDTESRSIASGSLSVHGDDNPQMHGTDNANHAASHYAENGLDNQPMNNGMNVDTISEDDNEHTNNQFRALPNDDENGNNSPLVFENNYDTHTPDSVDSAMESDNDPLQLDSERSGDRVDDNRHAVDMEASGIQIHNDDDAESGVDESGSQAQEDAEMLRSQLEFDNNSFSDDNVEF